eukprot:1148840-Pelagomonas_calceolata.AAC.6
MKYKMKGTLVLARIGNGGNGLYCSLTSLPVFCSFTPILDDPTYIRKEQGGSRSLQITNKQMLPQYEFAVLYSIDPLIKAIIAGTLPIDRVGKHSAV